MKRAACSAALLLSLAARDAEAQTPAAPSVAPVAPVAPAAVVAPRMLSEPDVPYPEGASGEAEVAVVLRVEESGAVSEATPDASAAEPFRSAAAAAASAFRFEPATRAGKPIAARIKVLVVFRPPDVVPAPAPPESATSRGAARAPSPASTPPARAAAGRTDDVDVRGARGEASRTVSLSRSEVRQIPGTFGDPFRAIEIMPGVTPIVSGLPFFFVRGAPPGNVGYFLDGVRVPYLFHVGAGPSVVHPGLVDTVDLYPGGYPARFGRFGGGIVSGETLPPAKDFRAEYNLRVFDVGALAEAPFADGRGTALVGGRYSYTGALLSRISPNTELAYWDYQARASYDVGAEDRLSVFAFGGYDYLGQRTPTETLTLFGTEFHRIDLRHDHKLPGGRLRTAVTLGLDRSDVSQDRSTRDRLLAMRTELEQRISDDVMVRAGTDVQLDRFDIDLGAAAQAPSVARVSDQFPSRTDLALGARADVVWQMTKRTEIVPGARVDLFSSDGATAVGFDPRVALRTVLGPRLKMLSALGVAHQAPAFAIPVPGFVPGGLRGGLQKAAQQSLGLELDLGSATMLTSTVFHNGFFDMSDPLGVSERPTQGCAPGAFPAGSLAGDRGSAPSPNGSVCGIERFPAGTFGPDRSGGGGQAAESRGQAATTRALEVRTRGAAYGLELFLKRRLTRRVGGFLSYTLSRSTRSYGDRAFVASFDRTHVANAALAFDLGRNWRAGTRVVFYTGLPQANDADGLKNDRLPPFFRLDLRLEKRWQLGQKTWISVVAEWLNATLTTEVVATQCTLRGCQSQTVGPVTIPSLGLEGGF
jgi:hypothetical protein